MSNIGVLIETGEDGVKETNFGVISAARADGSNEIYAFVPRASAAGCQTVLQEYGVNKVVEFTTDSVDLSISPDLMAEALADALNNFNSYPNENGQTLTTVAPECPVLGTVSAKSSRSGGGSAGWLIPLFGIVGLLRRQFRADSVFL